MEFLQMFLFNGILGHFLQAVSYTLSIAAFCRKPERPLRFFLRGLLFAVVSFLIRSISIISFGFHTILILAVFIFISVFVFKDDVFRTTLSVLVTTLLVTVCEAANYGVLQLIFGVPRLVEIMSGALSKVIAGIPANILLLAIIAIIYFISMRRARGVHRDGEIDSLDC